MKRLVFSFAAMAFALMYIVGCETEPKTQSGKEALTGEAQAALTRMEGQDPSLKEFLDRAAGYAIFPSIGKGAFIVGGSYGRGEVYQGGQFIGYADLTKGSVGLQAGGAEYSEIVVFQTQKDLDNFKSGNFTMSGDVSAVALKAGAAAGTQFKNGVAVFTHAKSGLMVAAAVGGQKFKFVPASGPAPEPTKP